MRRNLLLQALILPIAIFGCAGVPRERGPAETPAFAACQSRLAPGDASGSAEPRVNLRKLLELTEWVKGSPAPILSIAISRKGKILYELRTSQIVPDSAHYLMSVTKSVTSALLGVAIDRGLVPSTDSAVTAALPRSAFPDATAYSRFEKITLREVLGMSALDAPVAPHSGTPEAKDRIIAFFNAKNRLTFALSQKTLPKPGSDFQYTDVTPAIAAGVVENASGQSLLDLANASLFAPMGFRNQEWMHEDPAGIDNGAYGLRLRPVDMQKLGMLYLDHGCWQGKRLLSEAWVERSFSPWIKSQATLNRPDYGWYWWHYFWDHGWTAHIAAGWQGQRIAVFPEKDVVITMTGLISDGTENDVFAKVFGFASSAIDVPTDPQDDPGTLKSRLDAELAAVRAAPSRIPPGTETRMLPSPSPKQRHFPFRPASGT
jgi:CubicO group peptidase (beta-lactamase class C family)